MSEFGTEESENRTKRTGPRFSMNMYFGFKLHSITNVRVLSQYCWGMKVWLHVREEKSEISLVFCNPAPMFDIHNIHNKTQDHLQ
jgi:hypothetical protein